jgi:cyanate permease
MLRSQNARVLVALLLALVAWPTLGYQYAWHKDVVSGKPFQTIGWLLLVVFAVALVIHQTRKHNPVSVLIGFVLGLIAAAWGTKIFDHLSWKNFGWLALVAVLVLVPFALAFWKRPNLGNVRQRIRLPRRGGGNP